MSSFNYEDLSDSVRDWFYSHCARDCYDCTQSYIDDIRYAIAYNNDPMVSLCMDDLVNTYDMDKDYVDSCYDSVATILAEESQLSLDNFTYDNL